jgi:hypothetical protein
VFGAYRNVASPAKTLSAAAGSTNQVDSQPVQLISVTPGPNTAGLTEEPSAVVVAARLTVCVKAGDVLPVKLLLPPYTAVSAWLVAAKLEVTKLACPELFRVSVPSVVLPSRNVTVPVGVPAHGATGLTVAVNATAWPNTDGLADDDSAGSRQPGAIS